MNLYHESQLHIAAAEDLLRNGEIAGARERYRMAADLQWSLVDSLPEDRVRTKSVYGLSAATLYFRAQDLDKAEEVAYNVLSRAVEEHSGAQLRELARPNLERAPHERPWLSGYWKTALSDL